MNSCWCRGRRGIDVCGTTVALQRGKNLSVRGENPPVREEGHTTCFTHMSTRGIKPGRSGENMNSVIFILFSYFHSYPVRLYAVCGQFSSRSVGTSMPSDERVRHRMTYLASVRRKTHQSINQTRGLHRPQM